MVKARHLRISLYFLIGTLSIYWLCIDLAWHRAEPLELNVSAYQSHNWLYGHHYLYRVQLNTAQSCLPQDKYVCLKPVSFANQAFSHSACLYALQGECRGDGHFITRASRFYIPDEHKIAKAVFHQRGKITLLVSRLGPIFVKHFQFGRA